MRIGGSNRTFVIVSLLCALGFWPALPSGVQAQSIPESLANQLKPIKLLDTESCSMSVPDDFALMENPVNTQPPLAMQQFKRLSAEDVLSEDELLEYLASRASAPVKDAQMLGLVTISDQDSGAQGKVFTINGLVSVQGEYVDIKVVLVDADKITRETETGNYVVTVHDENGLAIDRFNYTLPQIVYLLGSEDIQKRIVDVELIECQSVVSWGFKVAKRTYLLTSKNMPFHWTLVTDVAASRMQINDGAQSAQLVELK